MQPAHVRAYPAGESIRGLLGDLARNAAADRLKAEQRDHAVVLVRQGLKDAKALPAMSRQIALLEAVATALVVIDGNTD